MLPTLAALLLLPAALQDDPAKKVAEWIERLDSDDLVERDEAQAQLRKLGRAAAALENP